MQMWILFSLWLLEGFIQSHIIHIVFPGWITIKTISAFLNIKLVTLNEDRAEWVLHRVNVAFIFSTEGPDAPGIGIT